MKSAPSSLIVASVLALACAAGASARPLEALTTDQPADRLSFVDLEAMKTVAEVEIAGRPAGIALSPDARIAYVTAPEGGGALVEVDADNRKVLRRLTLGGGPVGVAVNPATGEIYVADWYSHTVKVVEPKSFIKVAEIEVGKSPSGLAVTADGRLLMSADRDSDAVSIIDVAKRTRIASIAVGERPFGITIDKDARRAYSANVKSDDVSVIDIGSRKLIGRVPTGRRPYAVALAGQLGFSTDQYGGSLTVFDVSSLAVIKKIKLCDHPEGIEADASGSHVYVACWGDNVLLRIDVGQLAVTGKAPVADGPRAFGKFLR